MVPYLVDSEIEDDEDYYFFSDGVFRRSKNKNCEDLVSKNYGRL